MKSTLKNVLINKFNVLIIVILNNKIKNNLKNILKYVKKLKQIVNIVIKL